MKGIDLLNRMMRPLVIASLVFGISACGGGGESNSDAMDDDDDAVTTTLKGIFIDSVVIGLDYMTETKTGKTTAAGEFEYLEGETITFKVGDIVLGSTVAGEKITTFDIGDSLVKDETTGEYTDLNIATLLQSLDNNQNPADGLIDLTGIIANSTTGLSLEDGVTQDALDIITGEVGKVLLVSPEQVATHATISSNEAITESGGVLNLASTLSQEDVAAGNYRVYTKIGHQFAAVETVTANPVLYIESDITALSNVNLDRGRIRNRIDIVSDNIIYYMGLGIKYQNGAYSLHYFIEQEDPFVANSLVELPNNFVGGFPGVEIEENKTYKMRLELDLTSNEAGEIVYAYIDGVKAIQWLLPETQGDEGDTIVRAYLENRADSVIDEASGTGIAGTSLVGTFDNLTVHLDGETLLSDDFDDNKLSNESINFSERSLKAVSVDPSLTVGFLAQNPWYAISGNSDDCHATKHIFNLDGTGTASTINIDSSGDLLVTYPVTYSIDSAQEMTITFTQESGIDVQSYELVSITSDRIDMTFTDQSGSEPVTIFNSYDGAIEYVDDVIANPTCGDALPQ